MKKCMAVLSFCTAFHCASAQRYEAEQLLLNWEKLVQFKKILQNMYEGYKILYKGYTAVKDISEGSFSLHKTFLDALLDVSETVRKYKRIRDIIDYQVKIASEYKSALGRFKASGEFTAEELEYLGSVYTGLIRQTGKSLDELLMVVTAGELRMSDDERITAIDRIYEAVVDQFSFLKAFNGDTALLSLQRKAERAEIKMSRLLGGLER